MIPNVRKTMDKKFVIVNKENEFEFWANQPGRSGFYQATVFTEEEQKRYYLPVGGLWEDYDTVEERVSQSEEGFWWVTPVTNNDGLDTVALIVPITRRFLSECYDRFCRLVEWQYKDTDLYSCEFGADGLFVAIDSDRLRVLREVYDTLGRDLDLTDTTILSCEEHPELADLEGHIRMEIPHMTLSIQYSPSFKDRHITAAFGSIVFTMSEKHALTELHSVFVRWFDLINAIAASSYPAANLPQPGSFHTPD